MTTEKNLSSPEEICYETSISNLIAFISSSGEFFLPKFEFGFEKYELFEKDVWKQKNKNKKGANMTLRKPSYFSKNTTVLRNRQKIACFFFFQVLQ